MALNQNDGALSGSLVLTGVTVVDTRTGQLTPNSDVFLEAGTIRAIAPAGAIAPDPSTTVIPAAGKFLTPGFIDMHVHCLQDARPEDGLAVLLAHGVTGVRQMAGTYPMLEKRRNGGYDFGPGLPEILEVPGDILTAGNCPTPEAGVAEVRKQKEAGADFIKTIFVAPPTFFATLAESNRLGLKYGGHLSPGVDVTAASNAGMSFIEHLGGPIEMQLIKCSKMEFIIRLMMKLRPVKMNMSFNDLTGKVARTLIVNPVLFRLNMDPTGLEKTQKLLDSFSADKCKKLADTLVKNSTWQCPTLIRTETMQFGDEPRHTQNPDLRYVPAEVRAFWTEIGNEYKQKLSPAGKKTTLQIMDLARRMTGIFAENGVKMTTGSDYGGGWVIPGVSLHQEFDLLEQSGLSPLKVLQMATVNGAEFLKRSDLGTVEASKKANLVLLDANPIASVQNLHQVSAVVCGGNYFSNDVLTGMRQGVAARLAS